MNSENLTPENEDAIGPVVIKAKEHLPVNGILVPYAAALFGSTLLGLVLGHIRPITAGIPSSQVIKNCYIGFGFVFILVGLLLSSRALSDSNIKQKVLQGKLVTDGVYAWCRHPLYSGFLFISAGVLFISGNAFCYIIPIIGYFVIQHYVKNTEEQWLLNMFPDDYPAYQEKVNCLFPFPPKKK